MAGSILQQWLADATTTVRWIEFEDYARRVFANAPADWYQDPSRYAATLIQAQGVVATQCLAIDLVAPFLARHRAATDAATVVAALADEAALHFVEQALGALVHRFDKRLDLVLKLRCPFDLLCAGDASAAPAFDELDDVATAMAALLRRYADRPLAGLLLEKAQGALLSDDECEACEPLLGAARHYGWVTALALPGINVPPSTLPALDLDLLLLPEVPLSQLGERAGQTRLGGGLDAACWSGIPPSLADCAHLLYGTIPAAAKPETVLGVLKALG